MTSKNKDEHTVDITRSGSIKVRGSVISGHNVKYSVDVSKGSFCCGTVTQKEILKGVE